MPKIKIGASIQPNEYLISDKPLPISVSFPIAQETNGGSEQKDFIAGYYKWGPSSNDFSPSITFGSVNNSYGARLMLVLGAETVDTLTVRITGSTWNESTGTRTPADTEDIVISSASPVGTAKQTTKRWLGEVTIQVVSGTPKVCNYGFVRTWENDGDNFTLLGIHSNYIGGANDANADLVVLRHTMSGWTYGSSGTPTYPSSTRWSMEDSFGTDSGINSGEPGAWVDQSPDQLVAVADGEGIVIFTITTAVGTTFDRGTITLKIKRV